MRLMLLGLMALVGCAPSTPEQGDIYENLLTGDRVEISRTGECGGLYRSSESALDTLMAGLESASPETKRAALNMAGMAYMSPEVDSSAQCVSYQTPELINGHMMPIHDIVPVEEMQTERWKKLN